MTRPAAARRRVVVTGAAGMVGSHVVDRLVARGDQVVGVDDMSTSRRSNVAHLEDHPCFDLVVADVSAGIPVDGEVDAVLHLASPASPRHFRTKALEILRVGSTGTLHALELADERGATFLVASSSEVYGDPDVHPQVEEYRGNVDPLGERGCYDEAKRFAEAATDTYRRVRGLDTRIVRIFNTYGPRMHPEDGRVITNFVLQALRGEPITVYGAGTQTRSFCFVEDQARGIVALLDSDCQQPVNIGDPTEVTILGLARRVVELTGSDSQIVHEPLPEHDPTRRRPDITRATDVLGWQPEVSLEDGLRRTIEHFHCVIAET